jgi:phosphoenolpyruvate carboxylase
VIAKRHLEQVLHAVIKAGFAHTTDPHPEWTAVLEQLATASQASYRG